LGWGEGRGGEDVGGRLFWGFEGGEGIWKENRVLRGSCFYFYFFFEEGEGGFVFIPEWVG
jgi:hypothetical protein